MFILIYLYLPHLGHHFMANKRGIVETVAKFVFLGSKITADGDYIHVIKRHSLLGSKTMTKQGYELKGRDIILPTKVYIVKALVSPILMHGCESCTIKKVEHEELMFQIVLKKTLVSPLDCREIK